MNHPYFPSNLVFLRELEIVQAAFLPSRSWYGLILSGHFTVLLTHQFQETSVL